MSLRAASVAALALLGTLGACKSGPEVTNNTADDLVITSGSGASTGGASASVCQSPNAFSAAPNASAGVTSPTIARIVDAGAK